MKYREALVREGGERVYWFWRGHEKVKYLKALFRKKKESKDSWILRRI